MTETKRMSVTVTPRVQENLDRIAKRFGISQAEAVNRAINLSAYVLDAAGFGDEVDIEGTRYVFL